MKALIKIAFAAFAVFAVLQLVRPSIPAKPATAEIQVPPQVHQVLERDCYSCHSDQRRLAWFDQVVPAYWLVRHDILTAREHIDFSTLGSKPAAAQRATLFEAASFMQLGAMPLPQFTMLHPEAKVTPGDLATLKAYLDPWSKPAPDAVAPGPDATATATLERVRKEFNGVAFDPSFESWKVISTTERGDNNTFRFILGNDVAVRAAASGSVTPWPDGSRLAKVTWQRETRPDGLVYPGKFVQVELMVKDAKRYKDSEGWGFGRWRGLDLKPYGESAAFVNECTGCHAPMRADDYVYTLPIAAAKVPRAEVMNNVAASLPAGLPYQPLGWSPITLYVDPRTRTTATLYGNEAAIDSTHFRASTTVASVYQPGSVLALVTWAQREDPHWFGARIADTPLSVEYVEISGDGPVGYRIFAGAGLEEAHPEPVAIQRRTDFAVGLAPVSMP